MFNKSNRLSSFAVILSLLILSISCSIFYGGVNLMIRYSNVAINEFDYNLDNVHFFTREYLARQYQKFIAKKLPLDTSLPSFYLYADERDIESLEENLPESAKLQFKQSYLKVDDPEFISEAEFRYRGGIDLHWLHKKKSIRIKLPPFNNYRNERQFNLVNPSTKHTIIDLVSYDMARSIGLLAPEYFPARVFINNKFNGLHFFLSQIDESFLRKNNRMPGSIYSGDTLFFINPYLNKSTVGEYSFNGSDGAPKLWKEQRLWEKESSRNAESEKIRDDIDLFIKIANEADPHIFMNAFETYFDKEKFYLFWGLDKLVGSYHHDLFHNHKIYFDPYKGKFEPIEWDLRYWSTYVRVPVTPLYRQVLLNPVLKYESDLIIYDLWNKFSLNNVNKMIDDANELVIDELAADPYRIYSDDENENFLNDIVVHYSMSDYAEAIADLKQTYKVRHKYIEKNLNSNTVKFRIEKQSDNRFKITIAVNGNSPIVFNPWSIVSGLSQSDIEIFRVLKDEEMALKKSEKRDLLYPGTAISKETSPEQLSLSLISIYGLDRYSPSPLHYEYLIEGKNIIDLNETLVLTGKNAVTSSSVLIEHVDSLPSDDNTASLHPWELLMQTKLTKNEIILSGEIDVSQDMIFTEDHTVTIKPGTEFNLSENTSIYFYGKVIAKGTIESPIKFKAKETGRAWGSIVIQGKKASGSILNYIEVDGGSVTSRNLVEYPGQFNIHDVDSFELHHCRISNNTIGDDALHVAYSKGEIKYCDFRDLAFDALDMDIVDVTVSNSTFYNIGNDAIDLMTSKSNITNVDINGTGDKCISVGEASHVRITESQLRNCQMGIAVKDQSIVHVEDIEFEIANNNAISLYRKNPRYSSGGEIYGDRLSGVTGDDIVVGDYSLNKISKSAYRSSIDE